MSQRKRRHKSEGVVRVNFSVVTNEKNKSNNYTANAILTLALISGKNVERKYRLTI